MVDARIGVVGGGNVLADRRVEARIGAVVALSTDHDAGVEVVLLQPRPRAAVTDRTGAAIGHAVIQGPPVAADTGDRIEPVTSGRGVELDREIAAPVAGVAVAVEHLPAVHVVIVVAPVHAIGERDVGTLPEVAVARSAVRGVPVLGVGWKGLGVVGHQQGGGDDETEESSDPDLNSTHHSSPIRSRGSAPVLLPATRPAAVLLCRRLAHERRLAPRLRVESLHLHHQAGPDPKLNDRGAFSSVGHAHMAIRARMGASGRGPWDGTTEGRLASRSLSCS